MYIYVCIYAFQEENENIENFGKSRPNIKSENLKMVFILEVIVYIFNRDRKSVFGKKVEYY